MEYRLGNASTKVHFITWLTFDDRCRCMMLITLHSSFTADGVHQSHPGRRFISGLRRASGGRIQSVDAQQTARTSPRHARTTRNLRVVWGLYDHGRLGLPSASRDHPLHAVRPVHVRHHSLLRSLRSRFLHDDARYHRT